MSSKPPAFELSNGFEKVMRASAYCEKCGTIETMRSTERGSARTFAAGRRHARKTGHPVALERSLHRAIYPRPAK